MLADFIRAVAAARDIRTPTQMHAHLEAAGVVVTYSAVAFWWAGKTRRFDDERARELIRAFALTVAEIDALRDVQSGLGEGRAA